MVMLFSTGMDKKINYTAIFFIMVFASDNTNYQDTPHLNEFSCVSKINDSLISTKFI